jgi:hypothetical protein
MCLRRILNRVIDHVIGGAFHSAFESVARAQLVAVLPYSFMMANFIYRSTIANLMATRG